MLDKVLTLLNAIFFVIDSFTQTEVIQNRVLLNYTNDNSLRLLRVKFCGLSEEIEFHAKTAKVIICKERKDDICLTISDIFRWNDLD